MPLKWRKCRLLKVSPWMAAECENVAHFGGGHDVSNLTTNYSIMSVCNLFNVTLEISCKEISIHPNIVLFSILC